MTTKDCLTIFFIVMMWVVVFGPSFIEAYNDEPLTERDIKKLNDIKRHIVQEYLENNSEPLTRGNLDTLYSNYWDNQERNKILEHQRAAADVRKKNIQQRIS